MKIVVLWLVECMQMEIIKYWMFCEIIYCSHIINFSNYYYKISYINRNLSTVLWVHVCMARRVLRFRIGETTSRYGGYLRICWVSNREQPTRGVPPAWDLVEELTTPHRKKIYILFRNSSLSLEIGQILWYNVGVQEIIISN